MYTDTDLFKVVICAGCVRHDLYCGLTEQEAIDYCEENDWCYIDENEFEWSLDYINDIGKHHFKPYRDPIDY